jgi:hypothetical protein
MARFLWPGGGNIPTFLYFVRNGRAQDPRILNTLICRRNPGRFAKAPPTAILIRPPIRDVETFRLAFVLVCEGGGNCIGILSVDQ